MHGTFCTEATVTRARAADAVLVGAVGEDFAMGESIQRGLVSGANTEVVFGAFEHALRYTKARQQFATPAEPLLPP